MDFYQQVTYYLLYAACIGVTVRFFVWNLFVTGIICWEHENIFPQFLFSIYKH
jgi:hypothetical protein